MHIPAVTPGLLSYQDPDSAVLPADRLAGAVEPEPEPLPEGDLMGDYVQRILKEKMWAMIMGADEEESGIPPLDYEL